MSKMKENIKAKVYDFEQKHPALINGVKKTYVIARDVFCISMSAVVAKTLIDEINNSFTPEVDTLYDTSTNPPTEINIEGGNNQ